MKSLTTKKTCRVTSILKLNREALLQLLEPHGVPADAKVWFNVPGGGDWSSCDIAIDNDNPITVRWETVEEDED